MFKRILFPLLLISSLAFAKTVPNNLQTSSGKIAPLAPAKETLFRITKNNFDATLAMDKPVIIDVSAVWCGPCKQLKPIFLEFAQENKDLYFCGEIDADESQELIMKLGISGFPTVLVYSKKECIGKIVGLKTRPEFKAAIDDIISSAHKKISELTKEQQANRLRDAIQNCSTVDITKLIEAGVSISSPFADGITPLMFSISLLGLNTMRFGDKQALDLVAVLINNGASLKELEMNGVKTSETPRSYVEKMRDFAKSSVDQSTKVIALIDAKLAEKA